MPWDDLTHAGVHLFVPERVASHNEIEVAVAIGIKEARAGAVVARVASHLHRLGDILKALTAEIAKEAVVAQRGDVDIGEPIAIVVAGGDAGAVEAHLETKGFSDVFEVAGTVVLVGRQETRGHLPFVFGPVGVVDEEEIGSRSLSQSTQATPVPIDSGKYMLPLAPLT